MLLSISQPPWIAPWRLPPSTAPNHQPPTQPLPPQSKPSSVPPLPTPAKAKEPLPPQSKPSFAAVADAKQRKLASQQKGNKLKEYVNLTENNASSPRPVQYWLKELLLFPSDKESISEGQWLTDSVLTAGMRLLKQSHPHIGGLQPTILGETLAFEVQRSEFVQILNISGSHWLTVSNIGCKPGHVNVYDSLPSSGASKRTREQIAAIVFTANSEIILNFQAVQMQRGLSDCGLFALSFAATLCAGEDPVQTSYVQHAFRSHLLSCLESKKMMPFPTRNRKKPPMRQRGQVSYGVYCICRQPEHGKMAQCDLCQEWFHSDCVDIPKAVWSKKGFPWLCSRCS